MSPHDIGSGRDAPNLPACSKPGGLKGFLIFPQCNRYGPTAAAHSQTDEKNRHQGDGRECDQSIGSGKPLQHLLGLGIGILGGKLMYLRDHHVTILGMLEGNAYQKESQEEGKAQQTHHSAHARALPSADSNRAVAPVT
jgi:hypothetical protein